MNDDRLVRILCIDGGGIRGMVPTIMLTALQERLDRPVVEYFDVVAGTSTGGLLAAGLCAPADPGGPRYTLEDILGFYTRDCHRIFHRSTVWKIESVDGMAKPKYPADGIEGFLQDRFGDLELKDALRHLVLMSYDIRRREPWFFCSSRASRDPACNFLVRDACRASTAAPTFFPAAQVTSMAGESHELIDGGVCANDPVLAGFAEAETLFPGCRAQIVSLGTGNVTRSLDGSEAANWGAAGWALHILDLLSDGQSRMSEACMRSLMRRAHPHGSDYWRLQPELPPDLGHMDDTNAAHLDGLERVTRAYCRQQAATLEAIAAAIAG
jgi:patatin-like phospholipase/acyl hydrolase